MRGDAAGTARSYSEDMARRIASPIRPRRLARRSRPGGFTPAPAAAPVAELLRAAGDKGFVMGKTPVTTFLKARPDSAAGLDPGERAVATAEMRTLQRLHQITPEDDAIPVLRAMGMTSAQDVTAMAEPAFVTAYQAKHLELYGVHINWYLPRLVHRKAQQVSSIVYSLFATAQKINTQPAVAGISGPVAVQEAARDELIRHLPTLELLFGSLDFSECEHCGSVLSPAAYFVDLLQFIDVDPAIWANFVAQWEAWYRKTLSAPDARRPGVYSGPWVAERHTVVQGLLARDPAAVDPTVRRVIERPRSTAPPTPSVRSTPCARRSAIPPRCGS